MDIADIEYIRRFIVFGGCPYMIPKRGKTIEETEEMAEIET